MEVHLLTGSKRASSGLDLEDLLLQDFLLESLLWAWSAGVSPGLNVDLRVIGHFEVPIGLNSTNVLKGKSDTSRLRSILDWKLTKVPGELAQLFKQIIATAVGLIRGVVGDLILAKRLEEFFVHLGELEAFPKVGNTNLIVSNISETKERIITLAVDLDGSFLNMTTNWFLHDALGSLQLDRSAQVLGHLLSGDAHKAGIELEAKVRLESDVDLLLGLGVNNTLMVIELKAVVEDSLNVSGILAELCSLALNHLEFDVEVGVRLVRDRHRQGLGVADSDSAKVEVLRADLDHTVSTSSDNLDGLGGSRRLLHHAESTGVVHVSHLETRSW